MQFDLTLAVNDLEQTELFYRELLQLDIGRGETRPGHWDYLLLRTDQSSIVFRPRHILEAQHPALLQTLSRHPLGIGLQLEFSCPELPQLRVRIEQAGWPVSYELEDDQHRRRELWLQDPDGYILVLNADF